MTATTKKEGRWIAPLIAGTAPHQWWACDTCGLSLDAGLVECRCGTTRPTTEDERRAILVGTAARKGFRVAESWEVAAAGSMCEGLYRAMHNGEMVGPVFVRA